MTQNRLKRHAALVDDMAHARGIDLEEAAMRADLTPSDLSDMVLRCTTCTHVGECEQWLGSQVGAVSETPHYCKNADVFQQLARNSG